MSRHIILMTHESKYISTKMMAYANQMYFILCVTLHDELFRKYLYLFLINSYVLYYVIKKVDIMLCEYWNILKNMYSLFKYILYIVHINLFIESNLINKNINMWVNDKLYEHLEFEKKDNDSSGQKKNGNVISALN